MKIIARFYDVDLYESMPKLTKDIVVKSAFGNLKAGDIIPKGTTLEEYLKMKGSNNE